MESLDSGGTGDGLRHACLGRVLSERAQGSRHGPEPGMSIRSPDPQMLSTGLDRGKGEFTGKVKLVPCFGLLASAPGCEGMPDASGTAGDCAGARDEVAGDEIGGLHFDSLRIYGHS